CARGDYDPYW
nr:immunoglobulin heavy chain junction region [Mus musculus]MBK4183997.1 immunoglobulin heavy chain junction region [Mus musculus]